MTTHGFLHVLAEYDVLETFELLPAVDQEKFSAWIENATTEDSRWARLEAFVLALRVGPLQPVQQEGPSKSVG